jgi:hypothetical protein
MSLTGHLKDSKSPVNRFFLENLPNTKFTEIRLLALEGRKEGTTSSTPIWDAGELKVLPSEITGFPWHTVGTAFDYRARYFFKTTPTQDLVAHRGAVQMAISFGTQGTPRAFKELDAELKIMSTEFGPRVLSPEKELRLNRLCYVLALYEQVFRSPTGIDAPIGYAGVEAPLEELISLCSDIVANDLSELAKLFCESQSALFTEDSAILNPTFGASRMLGGADADLIVKQRLIDIKTTKTKPTPGRQYLWQLAGYVLSDLEDIYKISEVGFYFSRHGKSLTWSVDEFFNHLAGKKVKINKLRKEFEAILNAK